MGFHIVNISFKELNDNKDFFQNLANKYGLTINFNQSYESDKIITKINQLNKKINILTLMVSINDKYKFTKEDQLQLKNFYKKPENGTFHNYYENDDKKSYDLSKLIQTEEQLKIYSDFRLNYKLTEIKNLIINLNKEDKLFLFKELKAETEEFNMEI